MFNIIKDQFENTLGSFKYQNMQSNFFCINKGIRQTDAINPTLFSIFINDIGKLFEQNCNDPLELTESQNRFNKLRIWWFTTIILKDHSLRFCLHLQSIAIYHNILRGYLGYFVILS
jgi:hypothetical protein